MYLKCEMLSVCFSFVGLLLVAYSCGPEQGVFSDLPFDTIPHLIVYRTEGKGEDKVNGRRVNNC